MHNRTGYRRGDDVGAERGREPVVLVITTTEIGERHERLRPDLPVASVGAEVLERLRVLVVAGIPVGVLVAGGGSRVAMFVLRLTSPDWVRGATSDDGFVIGRFTLSGTYNLLVLGSSERPPTGRCHHGSWDPAGFGG